MKIMQRLYCNQYMRTLNSYSVTINKIYSSFLQIVFSTLVFRKQGILSLTEKCDNLKMWALYAQNTGFCLEWDVKQFPFVTK